jgi:release factor glutamine methyltransferase
VAGNHITSETPLLTKTPAEGFDRAYLFGDVAVKLVLKKGVWPPSTHAQTIGNALAHFPHLVCAKSVLDVGTGSGILAIIAARQGAAQVDVTELDAKVLDAAQANARLNGVQFRNVLQRDWLQFAPSEPYDVLIANPPFFDVHQRNRRAFIDETIHEAPIFLKPGGYLLLVHSGMADFGVTERDLKNEGFNFQVVESYRGLFRDAYYKESGFLDLCQRNNGFEVVDDFLVETVRVYLCALGAPQPNGKRLRITGFSMAPGAGSEVQRQVKPASNCH